MSTTPVEVPFFVADTETAPPPSQEGPGYRLKKTREAKHISVTEIADRIHITEERVLQIEKDDYSGMNAPVFAKGYLQSYAKQLGWSASEIASLLQRFDELHFSDTIQRKKKLAFISERVHSAEPLKITKNNVFLIYLISGLFLVSILIYLWYQHSNSANKVNTTADKNVETLSTSEESSIPGPSKISTPLPVQSETPTTPPISKTPTPSSSHNKESTKPKSEE